jgi:hypothetical protein
MKKELICVACGFAISEIGDLVVKKIIAKRKRKSNYEDQWKSYAMRNPVGIFDNNLEEAVKFTESLINTKEMQSKKFRYTPTMERPREFPLDQLYYAAWGMA